MIITYYMDRDILLKTKTLIALVRHYIQDSGGVSPYVTLRSDKTIPTFLKVLQMASSSRFAGLILFSVIAEIVFSYGIFKGVVVF